MSVVEISEVIKFLKHTLPFQFLSPPDLRSMAAAITVHYMKGGRVLNMTENSVPVLHIIRRGAFEIRSSEDHLVDRISDGECYGISTVVENNPEGFSVVALEDSLVYQISIETFQKLCASNAQFFDFFHQTRENRLRKLSTSKNEAHSPTMQLNQTIRSLMSDKIVHISKAATVSDAARTMTEHRVSSILILENKQLVGILTDRDLRSRILAEGKSGDLPVADVMTQDPISLDEQSLTIHAQLLMSERNIHHLPIVNTKNEPIGILTATDLLRSQQLSPVLMVSEINRQTTFEPLSEIMSRLPKLVNNLILSEVNGSDIGEIIAAISDSLARQIIKIFITSEGEPPMAFNLLVFGSQARFDQSLGSDQDNALMLARKPVADELGYFLRLGKVLADVLNDCGFDYCPGNIMASNIDWLLDRKEWHKKFQKWVAVPSPKSLLNASIFFDIRSIYGDNKPVEALQSDILALAKANKIFQATLTRNAIRRRAPLGFFRDFVLDQTGANKDHLDLKHHGLALINDLARIYALASGSSETATIKRLRDSHRRGVLPMEHAKNLEDGWEFLSELRLKAQQENWQITGNATAFMDPSTLSQLERQHLKSTFKVISQAQDSAQNAFARGLG